ncbi:hypothetical protein SEMRO_1607_G285570.1 [Seminavis robusta]|uniref:Uncharacterized protein n=1 Tax=Seminavis robusta TaxID=568900 RepID=A0A9N8ETS8_9STRA|nr:hypothetical protein SEMRO_1607_G285570.1 [Seminavis robusta]|eukprot:Sro1607_g285570.1 n/a (224) ;mRNA; r:8308-8979
MATLLQDDSNLPVYRVISKTFISAPDYQKMSKAQSFQNYRSSISAHTPQKLLQKRESGAAGPAERVVIQRRGRRAPGATAKKLAAAMKLKQSREEATTKLEVDRLVQKNVLSANNASVWINPAFPTALKAQSEASRRHLVIAASEWHDTPTATGNVSKAKPEEILVQVDISLKATTMDLSIAYTSTHSTSGDMPDKQAEWSVCNASSHDKQLRASLMGLDSRF